MVQSPGPAAGGTSLPGLLHELSDVLVASSSGVGANVDVEMRMREVVVHVVEKIVPAAGKARHKEHPAAGCRMRFASLHFSFPGGNFAKT